jgi:hypothetical protein
LEFKEFLVFLVCAAILISCIWTTHKNRFEIKKEEVTYVEELESKR